LSTIWGVAYTEYLSDPRVRRESEALARRGDQVTVLCLAEAGRPLREDVRGVAVRRLPMRRYRGGGVGQSVRGYGQFFVRALAWMATHRPPDVVHLHTVPDALVFAAAVPRVRGSRLVLDVHDLTPDLYALKFGERSLAIRALRLIEHLSLGFAQSVITVHEPYRALLAARGVAPERLHVVMNVADDSLFQSAAQGRAAARSDANEVRFVYHGTLTHRYGVDVLLRALARARTQVPGVRLSVHGDGDYRSEAVRLATELGLDGLVEFSPGFVPVDELPALLAQADVGVVPNRRNPFTEHILPTKLLEYATLGLPTVVSETGVVRAYFGDDMVRYVRPGDVNELSRALVELARDPAVRRHLRRNIQRFQREYNWANNRQALFRAIDGDAPPAAKPAAAAALRSN
jgi:glycosyltransferase involved in cell wall biosynthesis